MTPDIKSKKTGYMNKKMYVSPILDTILIEQAILSADSMKVHVDDTKPEDEVKDVEEILSRPHNYNVWDDEEELEQP